jgi:hypothetical protein
MARQNDGGEENPLDTLDEEKMARFIIDMMHRAIVHHTLWFSELIHQIGLEKALRVMQSAFQRGTGIQIRRLAEFFGIELENSIPKAMLAMPRERKLQFMGELAKNWLANDGVWFQSVEESHGMNDAKRCNDTCWTRFSPFEACSIKQFLELPEKAGLEGLKKGLQLRMYAFINRQSIIDEGPNSMLFQMNDCRVQSARKRKGLPDYPCRSAGLVEYRSFAETIDSRINTECLGCPPDSHPDEWYCAWRFSLNDGN